MRKSLFLVTGGAGFIGSNLIEQLLDSGHAVRCMDNFYSGKRANIAPFASNPDFSLLEADIRDYDACLSATKGVDYVFHEAAIGSVPCSIDDPMTSTDVNIGGFVKVLHAAKVNNVKRVIYAASSATYGDDPTLPKVEDKIGNPLSPYAITKYANELFAKNFYEIYGLESVGLRYFNVFGRRQDPFGAYAAVIPRFADAMLKHQSPVVYGDGTQSRDFTFVDNVVEANFKSLTAPKAPGEVFNVGFGDETSLLELFDALKLALSKFDQQVSSLKINFEPARTGDIPHSLADISKARNLLGYDPKISVADGIAMTAEFYYNNQL